VQLKLPSEALENSDFNVAVFHRSLLKKSGPRAGGSNRGLGSLVTVLFPAER